MVTALSYAAVNLNKDTTYYTIFPPERKGEIHIGPAARPSPLQKVYSTLLVLKE